MQSLSLPYFSSHLSFEHTDFDVIVKNPFCPIVEYMWGPSYTIDNQKTERSYQNDSINQPSITPQQNETSTLTITTGYSEGMIYLYQILTERKLFVYPIGHFQKTLIQKEIIQAH